MTSQRKHFTHAAVTVGATTTVAMAQSDTRTWVLLVNDSDETIYVSFGAAAVMNQGIRLNAGGGALDISSETGFLDQRQINAICASGAKTLLVTHA